ncbi:MAG: bifunctional demethylmenaquinone methyltransferase/2-methoxy-6-polyprenyl-1,4-benzoquinol methylase UbiE [Desulfobacterales bacterium]|nr:bifunctional demethylmenaquinone methyltransferase/2-methoxy-6-polyprenyl-1,4-benzoquinol methylase UbiE [Desulfobacterales bacterium]MDD4071693.1 bifunctional demethylmenaquinone methyltransferase/2-methoxy-6-polyprenyl-1,4-benzoquinol methylase UbiE [Desulfobacterales bacterium]MDD4391403.1 bifunctional demethylmenaquinone methyltransferase/2-methoxy-6-polyprenyl-1,4-benzoquinol methylase UbiE [Desulfobacterales bacterium]
MKNVELPFIKDMFDTIAPTYDFLNRLLSLRQDVYWRKKLVSSLALPDGACVLDVACGTGDVMMEIARQRQNAWVVGVDFASNMLELAGKKIYPSVSAGLAAANALHLPFGSRTFDAVTIAFGIRNIGDKLTALQEFYSCLKPGGCLGVLELATPENRLLLSAYLTYFQKILPAIGGFFSRQIKAYRYLPESVVNFPKPAVFAGLMRQAGFMHIRWQPMTMGIVNLYIGYKA